MSLELYLDRTPLEDCAKEFGVSKPTISRWKSEEKYPEFAEIIWKLKNELKKTDETLSKLTIDKMRTEEELMNIKSFFRELSK